MRLRTQATTWECWQRLRDGQAGIMCHRGHGTGHMHIWRFGGMSIAVSIQRSINIILCTLRSIQSRILISRSEGYELKYV